jgi:hypothetical protein
MPEGLTRKLYDRACYDMPPNARLERGWAAKFPPEPKKTQSDRTAFQKQKTLNTQRWVLPEGWTEWEDSEDGSTFCRCV